MRLTGSLSGGQTLSGSLTAQGALTGAISTSPGQGTKDYNRLSNRPTINAVVVEGEKVGADYRLQDKMHELTIQEIELILYSD